MVKFQVSASFAFVGVSAALFTRQQSLICGDTGYGRGTNAYIFQQNATLANQASCGGLCAADTKCLSYAYGNNACLLFTATL